VKNQWISNQSDETQTAKGTNWRSINIEIAIKSRATKENRQKYQQTTKPITRRTVLIDDEIVNNL
jgi:hypothetical protein